MRLLELNIVRDGISTPLEFMVKRMVNAGYVGRDQDAVKAHIEELRREGVPPPPSIPMAFPVLSSNITTSDQIEVISDKTSGEVEFVLLLDGSKIFVGIGSDHTDRELESHSIVQSKQVCPNVLSRDLWDYEDVKDVWDDLLIQSWVTPKGSSDEILYQKAELKAMLSAQEILTLVESRIKDAEVDGLVIYSGTVPILTDEIIYGRGFRCELTDPASGRKLSCKYSVLELNYLKD